MSEFLSVLGFSLSVTGPIFIVLALGVVLKRVRLIDDAFIASGSRLVFVIALPVLLFISVAKTRLGESSSLGLVGYGLVMTLLVWGVLEALARRVVRDPRDRGVVVQGGFRSNMGIIGLAYCVNAYGDAGLSAASLYVGLVTILFNVLSVITLSQSLQRRQGWRPVLKGVATNPLIIGIVAALPISWLGTPLPQVLLKSGQYFADLSLPLALLCTGAALDFKSLREGLRETLVAGAAKLLLVPLLFTAGGVLLGFRGVDLGVLLLMSSAPTAAASYVMVRAMGLNAALGANIIALTTLGSILTTSAGVALLRGMGLM